MFRTRVRHQTEGECALSPGMLLSGNAWLPESLDDGLCQGQCVSVWSGEDRVDGGEAGAFTRQRNN